MLHIRLIGSPGIEDAYGDRREVRGRKPWALLARVLLADRALTRRELSVELFPDAADPLGSLRWCLASLRKAIGSAEVLTGDPVLRELPDWVSVDVYALRDGVVDTANIGELLEGVDPPCGPEFATWLLVARQQVSSRIAAQLCEATIKAISRDRHELAVELAELAARRSSYDEGAHVLLVKALVAAGHPEAALEHVISVESLFRDDLGCDPTPALRSAARVGVAAAPPGLSPGAVASSLLRSGQAAMADGRLPQAKSWLHQCLEIAHELQWMSFEPWPVTALAEAHLTERSRSKSPDDLERCFATSCQLEDPCWEGASARVLALHYAQAGQPDDALSWITDARQRAVRRTDTWVGMIGAILLTEARIRQSAGDTAGANTAARELVAFAARAQLDQLLEQGLAITHVTT